MVTSLFLAWALIVQVHIALCQDGVCTPHPHVRPRSQVVQTLASESECLLQQMDLQRAYRTMPARAGHPRRYVDAKRTFLCQPTQ